MPSVYFGSNFTTYAVPAGLAVILLLALVLVIYLTRRSPRQTLDKEYYQAEFLKIFNTCETSDPNSTAMTVINGDNLVDKAMMELGLPGKTMGERLKNSPKRFSNIDSLWSAHKMRNKIVHEAGFVVTSKMAREALMSFKRALKDLGAI